MVGKLLDHKMIIISGSIVQLMFKSDVIINIVLVTVYRVSIE
jgi:hypothetical protein